MTPPTSIHDRLAQLMFVRIGSNMPPPRTVEADAEETARLLAQCPLGGLCLFNGHGDRTGPTLARLQAQSRYPLLVASDLERGAGQQLRDGTLFPHARAFGMLGEGAEDAVRWFARITARQALAQGVHLSLSPVADVDTDPRNPIIATRAFGSEPERVAALGAAYLDGCNAEGILSAAKHFPGHGHTHTDSHEALPVVTSDRATLDAVDLLPFRHLVEREVPLIMTAHVAFPALDPSGTPATLSRPILTDLLRGAFGFRGAVITDSLLMSGVQGAHASPGDVAVAALEAGADILLDVAEPLNTWRALRQALDEGRLSEARVQEAFARLWSLKEGFVQRFGSPAFFEAPRAYLPAPVPHGEASSFAREIARRAVTHRPPEEAPPPFVPSGDAPPFVALFIRPHTTPFDPPEQPLGTYLRERFPDVRYAEIGPATDRAAYDAVHDLAVRAHRLLLAFVVKPAAWHRFGLLPEQDHLVRSLVTTRPAIVASLGVPTVLEAYPGALHRLCTYSDVPVSQRALADAVGELIGPP